MTKREDFAPQRRAMYAQFSQNTEGVHLFAQAWWLDAVCGKEGWDAVFDIDKVANINGAMAFPLAKKWGADFIKIPVLSAYTGVWLRLPAAAKNHQIQSFERNTWQVLLGQMPKTAYTFLYMPPTIQNWQPFDALGWRVEPMLTHILDLTVGTEQLFAHFKENTQRKIKKSHNQFIISESRDMGLIYGIYERIMASKGGKMAYSLDFLKDLDREIQKHQAGKLYVASDTEGVVHAALYIVWDATTAYYWLGGAEVENRNSGASTFLIWEILKDLTAKGIQSFDFTGSTVSGLEVFFSSFGTEKRTFFKVSKYGNRGLQLLHRFKK